MQLEYISRPKKTLEPDAMNNRKHGSNKLVHNRCDALAGAQHKCATKPGVCCTSWRFFVLRGSQLRQNGRRAIVPARFLDTLPDNYPLRRGRGKRRERGRGRTPGQGRGRGRGRAFRSDTQHSAAASHRADARELVRAADRAKMARTLAEQYPY